MRFLVSVCLLALFTAACSKVPAQSGYSYSSQHKVQSADHWQRLADDVVSDQIAPFLKRNQGSNKIYIEQKDRSDFGIAFNTYLSTELFDEDIEILETYDKNAVTLEWSVQRIRHSGKRKNPHKGIVAGIGYLAAEFFVGGDSYHANSNVPNTEIIISTKLVKNGKPLSIETETFYVDGKDTGNYWLIEDYEQGLAYINKGSVVCKNKRDLYFALNDDGLGYSSLSTLSALGDCTVMSKNHPVNIISNDGQSLVIRSLDDATTYVTSPNSISQI